ncbi:MAG: hypothetical protein A3I26_03410 [Candidatus Yanofskybacteria bacterium RIFCSPLOWO2_02_FULL_43_10]|uniref:Uncharacterized protein n=1 Tax=Candidatus Yanofskybacteria bacterium RIFCSPLOWO2_12_FULL_43_11b TaxID=1802710 RepID=A0A1F8H9F6_9BACT|nr:MAG: hypothetical protein A2742_00500 [Candidatus Yanofskybacteria bacterium RIFCSPHIGHO2_01_FULL_43_32]OGN11246.1 MAG: hypothetical protein A3C69_00635 [Candidatus Yanofskybacteria bacterium RIFCSPHIGHO2_02_FULL_43_12]OGN17874.1 MAG: hypothetical protein A3E34_00350 [Candidatus Yanofskybacteria bacterium RIFCSPHIGHO2_12_FULL_43_11]OGN24166.1 MAG: hypothetical protein A2923_02440 [Candidatus Yanofskybacteria bacterium RIFCSPLOWO2_01_FULL_43_46]OGN28673.1 MAG: hypothetical protein A3I26_03410
MKLFQERKIVRAIQSQINNSDEPGAYRTSNFVPKESFILYFSQWLINEKDKLNRASRIKRYFIGLRQNEVSAAELMQVLQYCIDDGYVTRTESDGYRLTSAGAYLASLFFWLPSIPVAVSIIAIVISFLGFSYSRSTFEKLLPEHQANIIFSEESIKIAVDSKGVWFQPVIKNIGVTTAREVRFRIYITLFQKNNPIAVPEYSVNRVFNDYLVADLNPGEKASFGSFSIGRTSTAKNGKIFDLFEVKPDVAIIFHLNYVDPLSKKIMSKFFIFHYFYGRLSANSLIGDDYQIIKDKIVQYLENEENKDQELVNFVREKYELKKHLGTSDGFSKISFDFFICFLRIASFFSII